MSVDDTTGVGRGKAETPPEPGTQPPESSDQLPPDSEEQLE